MSDEHEPAPPGGDNPLGGLLERARPDAGFAAQQSLQMLQSRLFGRTAQSTMVGRYTLGPRLGAGGGGTVYRALDTANGRTVAIKLLISEGRGSSARARLLREAQSLAKLRHPNIVEFHEVGTFDPVLIDPHATNEADDGVFLAMELVEGDNLATWAEAERPWKVVLEVFIAAGHGLAYAHARGFAHRDFKPSNVLVGNDGRTRVADFGLARVTRELTAPLPGVSLRLSGESSLPGLHVSLTKPGTVVGTPAYMAPEQHLSSRADARSDQFSFCLALYEALYRRSPFVGPTPGKILEAKLRGIVAPPPPVTRVPVRVYRAIVRGLAPDPAGRHPSMNALIDALGSDRSAPTRAHVIGAVTCVAALGIVGAGLSLRGHVGDPCAELPNSPPGWTPEIAATLQRASGSLGLGYGVNAFERVREHLDRYQGEWSEARTRICAADHAEQMSARLGCLDEHARLLVAMTTALADPRDGVLERAAEATDALPDPRACLWPHPALYVESGGDEATATLRDELARTRVAVELGRPEAGALAEQLLARAQAGEHPALVPEARILVARTEPDPDAAATSLTTAWEEAHALDQELSMYRSALAGLELAIARNDLTGARAWVPELGEWSDDAPSMGMRQQLAIAEVNSFEPDAPERTAAMCSDARAIVEHAIPSSVTAVAVARRCTALASFTGRIADALVEAERAAAIAERFYGSDHPIAALTRIELATALMAAGRQGAALAQARSGLDLLERTTLADDPRRMLALLLLAELERERDPAASGRHRNAAETIAQLDDTHRLAHAEATFSIALALEDRVRAHELSDVAHGRARRLGGARLAARITHWLAR